MVLAVVIVIAVLLAVLIGLGAFALRRRLIQRAGGTFDCSARLRMPPLTPAGPDAPAEAGAAPADAPLPSGSAPAPVSADDGGKGWVFGIARYNNDSVEWFRVFSYAPRPRRVLQRSRIEVLYRRTPEGQEELALLSGAVVLTCLHAGEPLELAMSEDALTGFLAWLEAAPPGQRVNVA
ncbi:DUF2550 domain-containing protein [Streptacidiphilus sp. PB12-B1b]|uniref:DUF2550 domain-containing protein n=1 Tax=Streptacidiphilus sp. PB12-B1b TaxID=2705012 RepID=UPI0015F8C11F|nr:DUF2550 domain-containing protein [Streptacidiphilus sp. PB12-B1b]QMU79147.1 DUF2550 domain-containing protein [Streptacidiphilus sp. PB12-B1b]